jgi:hypothetical protein
MTVSGLLVIPLIICTGLMGDWYGVANAGAIVTSIAARLSILGQQRYARDYDMKSPKGSEEKLCIITRSDGKMVTIRATLHVLMGIRRPAAVWHPKFYGLAQQAAWIALGTHLLVLGMCTLVTQIYTVVLLVSSTVAISSTTDWSADTQHKTTTPRHDWLSDRITTIPFNDDWDVIKTDPEFRTKGNEGHRKNYQMDRRLVAWARLGLSRQEEVTMISWQLVLEMEKGATWWMEYRCLRDAFAAEGGQNSDACIAPWNMVMRPPASSTET